MNSSSVMRWPWSAGPTRRVVVAIEGRAPGSSAWDRSSPQSSLPAAAGGRQAEQAVAEAADHGPGDDEWGGRVLEDGRDVPLEGEVAKEHERITGEEQGDRPERPERQQDDPQGAERPADADVEDVVDRVPMVLAVLRHEPVELRCGDGGRC